MHGQNLENSRRQSETSKVDLEEHRYHSTSNELDEAEFVKLVETFKIYTSPQRAVVSNSSPTSARPRDSTQVCLVEEAEYYKQCCIRKIMNVHCSFFFLGYSKEAMIVNCSVT